MSQNATRAAIVAMLRDGHSNSQIARELRCDKGRVRRIRTELDLPTFVPAEQTRTIEDKWRLFARAVDGGHMEWTGERVGAAGSPVMRYKDSYCSPSAIAFELRHGRPPQGYAIADCGRKRCIAPDHVEDEAGRLAKRQEIRRANGLDSRPETCQRGHDQTEHGRLEQDGRPYCAACKRLWKTEPEAQREARASAWEAVQRDIETMLRQNVPQMHIAKQLGVAPVRVQRTREALDLPAPRPGRPDRYSSLEDAFRQNTTPVGDGHLRWTGYTDTDRGIAYVCFRKQRLTAARVSFELHHGRPPVGRVLPGCEVDGCLAGGHLADRPMREANGRADKAFDAIFRQSA
ncbi:helix-turn-helix domain-containing protein [Streptomyces sp. NPDC056948]|uniref:helix-turn-helix domain-containing protein n=1 Tax=Streptomyces sp. NPDC056948 TaxID=3345975 RepID=UPI003642FE9F